jgi:hypothetical protein
MRMSFWSGVVVLATSLTARADDPAQPVTVTSGYNADIVADGSGSAGGSTTTAFDASGNVFYDTTYDTSHGNYGGALPAGQTIHDMNGNLFSLAPAAGNNALLISSDNPSASLGLSYSLPAGASLTSLLLLGTSAEGDTILDYTLNFIGGASTSGSFTLSDWHNLPASGAFNSFGRIDLMDEYNDETGRTFSLYTIGIEIPDEDKMLQLASLDLNYDAANVDNFGIYPRAGILSVSAFDPVAAPEPGSYMLALCSGAALLAINRRRFLKN